MIQRVHKLPFSVVFILLCSLLCQPGLNHPLGQASQATANDIVCRFGITSVMGSEDYDLTQLGVGAYLDWGAGGNPALPTGVEYIRVLRLRDDLYPAALANLPGWLSEHPGSVWVVGNEPDTTYGHQDALLPEDYADRYYDVATIIRQQDPSARIAFGPVVQPTPIRIHYLDRAWKQLSADAGGDPAASKLIDIWSIHSFILNEQAMYWGSGIPPGFDSNDPDAIKITDFSDTYSIEIFQQRVIAFRDWMLSIGEREKPLWITEYGSLFPPEDPPGGPNYYNVSNQDTADYMLATFDFLLSSKDDTTGYPQDGNQLVQRWFWYSLNDYPYNYGGSLYDPRDGSITLIGEDFRDYQPISLAQPDLFPISVTATPVSFSTNPGLVNYHLKVTIGNALSSNTSSAAKVWIYEGNPESGGIPIGGPVITGPIQRCGGSNLVVVDWNEVQPLTEHTLYVVTEPIGVVDSYPGNNTASFTITTGMLHLRFLPLIQDR